MTSLAESVIFGAVCGIALFIGENAVSAFAGDQMFLHITLISLLVSVLLGGLAGGLSHAIRPLARTPSAREADHEADRREVAVRSAVFILFVQGVLIITFTFLPRIGLMAPISIVTNLSWALLCLLVVLFTDRMARRKPALLRGKLALGLLIAVMSSAVLAILYGRPYTITPGPVINHVLLMFGASVFGFLISFFLIDVARASFRRSHSLRSNTQVIVALCVLIPAGVAFHLAGDVPSEENAVPDSAGTGMPPNVILIVLDTLRPDHLSCYGYDRPTSPNLDEFSRRAVRFENCYSTANWTVPGHASIFTGRYVITHGAHKGMSVSDSTLTGTNPFFCSPLPDEEIALAEILEDAGYHTAAFVANHACVTGVFGLDQGFDLFDDAPPFSYRTVPLTILGKLDILSDIIGPYQVRFRIAENINGRVFDWLDRRRPEREPFLLFINYMDTHDPYFPPPRYQDIFPGKIENFRADIHQFGENHHDVTDAERAHLTSQYDGEIAYLDAQLGRLFEHLKSEHLFDRSIIVVTSDHGEYLGEHDLYGHSLGLYNPVIRVPLIVKAHRGCDFESSVTRPVQTIDILPTVLHILGLDPPAGVQGEPLLADVTHPVVSEHYAGSNYRHTYDDRYFRRMTSLVEGTRKYIRSADATDQMFDLSVDPLEKVSLVSSLPDSAERLLAEIEAWESSVPARTSDEGEIPRLTDEALDNLRALGYIQ